MVRHVRIDSSQAGQKILSFLRREFPDVPASALHRALRRGEVRLNSRRCKPFMRIACGDEIRIPPFSSRSGETESFFTGPEIDILHAASDFFIVRKPAGLAVHGGRQCLDSVVRRLRRSFPDESFQSTPVHRLDKQTSGLLLVARSYLFLRHMHNLWTTGAVKKTYLAWVEGCWPFDGERLLRDEMEKQETNGREKMETGQGKAAWCRVQCLRQLPDRSLLCVCLGSGRTHQIRVQLGSRGFPIIGDGKYGHAHAGGRIFLHACSLAWENCFFCDSPNWPPPYHVVLDQETVTLSEPC